MRRSSRRGSRHGRRRRPRSSTAFDAGSRARTSMNEPARSGGLFVGRLVAENGISTLLEALDLFPGARIDVVGSGPDEARLAAHPRVRVLGRVGPGEMQDRMYRAAYLVMPSLSYEDAPRPLVEAFAAGLPVIASRIGSLAELVEPGRNGLLFEPGSGR